MMAIIINSKKSLVRTRLIKCLSERDKHLRCKVAKNCQFPCNASPQRFCPAFYVIHEPIALDQWSEEKKRCLSCSELIGRIWKLVARLKNGEVHMKPRCEAHFYTLWFMSVFSTSLQTSPVHDITAADVPKARFWFSKLCVQSSKANQKVYLSGIKVVWKCDRHRTASPSDIESRQTGQKWQRIPTAQRLE